MRLSENLPGAEAAPEDDIGPLLCRGGDKTDPPLPRDARLPINRCNLPASILGGLTYQRHPTPLALDGVADLHRPLFELLDDGADVGERAECFKTYMAHHFRLNAPEEAGLGAATGKSRARANYLKVVMGWAFDPDGREAAVLKGWVESRFGLLPRYHAGPLRDTAGPAYARYEEMRCRGLYGTNALEAQLDLLYAFCQYELQRRYPQRSHVRLYRGVNRLADHEVLREEHGASTVLLNSVNSFSRSKDRAGEFGDYILGVDVPLPKLLFFSSLLPGMLKGEDEYVVIGGLYRVRLAPL
ncbi:MAG TPA: NAD(+)--dinitrogen-reductase ADP-D-ribosyltransferase [Rhodocyclaceae bacterium]